MDNFIQAGDTVIEVASYAQFRKVLRGMPEYDLSSRAYSRNGARSGQYVICDCAAPRHSNIVFTAPDQATADQIYNRILSGK